MAKETIRLPRAGEGEERDMFVSVNGQSYLIPRNQSVEVPDYIAEEVRRSQRATDAMYEELDKLKNLSK